MKNFVAKGVVGIILVFAGMHSHAQTNPLNRVTVIEPYRLKVTYSKTTHLIFPFAIQSVDLGSKDLLAQKPHGVENILEIKAAKRGFEETNLTVITKDGRLYSYLVNYTDVPSILSLRFPSGIYEHAVEFSSGTTNDEDLRALVREAAAEKKVHIFSSDRRSGVGIKVSGIFIHDSLFCFRMVLENSTPIAYGIDQFRFFIRDQKKMKRTAAQELELVPLYTYGNTSAVSGQTRRVLVFVLSTFTIPEQKFLGIEVTEKNGGRHLDLTVSNSALMKAEQL
ncbi:MAG: conjugative transposon protein TraN [Sphingobacteriales bacterium]